MEELDKFLAQNEFKKIYGLDSKSDVTFYWSKEYGKMDHNILKIEIIPLSDNKISLRLYVFGIYYSMTTIDSGNLSIEFLNQIICSKMVRLKTNILSDINSFLKGYDNDSYLLK